MVTHAELIELARKRGYRNPEGWADCIAETQNRARAERRQRPIERLVERVVREKIREAEAAGSPLAVRLSRGEFDNCLRPRRQSECGQ